LYQEGGLFEENWDSEKALARKIERDPESLLVAVRNGEIVGTISLVEDGRMAFLFRLVVKEKVRKGGIGSKLIAEGEKRQRKYYSKHIIWEIPWIT